MATRDRVLITGASGFLGRRIVEMLASRGLPVRAMVRKTTQIEFLKIPDVEISYGDVTDLESLRAAFDDIDLVVHAAADNTGTEEGARQVTIAGTRNVLELSAAHHIKKLVYISSCSVYETASNVSHKLSEDAPLERYPEKRGIYSWAKIEAEKLVIEFMQKGLIPVVCLRPGTIYGPGGNIYTHIMGFSLRNKLFAVIGDGGQALPLVYIDNLVEAIIASLKSERSDGQIYNVVDPYHISKKTYIEKLICRLYPNAIFIYLPYKLLNFAVMVQEVLFAILRKKPFLTRYRLASSQNPTSFDSSRIISEMGWDPQVLPEETFERLLQYERMHKL